MACVPPLVVEFGWEFVGEPADEAEDVDQEGYILLARVREGLAVLYQSMLKEGDELKAIADKKGLSAPVLAIGAGSGEFTIGTMSQVAAKKPRSELLKGVGHYAALEAPAKLAKSIGEFVRSVDTTK